MPSIKSALSCSGQFGPIRFCMLYIKCNTNIYCTSLETNKPCSAWFLMTSTAILCKMYLFIEIKKKEKKKGGLQMITISIEITLAIYY